MRFCSNCDQPAVSCIPAGDSRLRDVCDHHNTIYYVNPCNMVDTMPVWNDQVLLCRRAIEPRYGPWTLPADFMEIGETIVQAANRETVGEVGVNVETNELYSVLNVPRIHQVRLFYLAKLNDLGFAPGEESLEVTLSNETDIPWDDLAFPTVIHTLRCFFADRTVGRLADGSFRLHALDIYKPIRSAATDTPATTS